MLCFVYFYRQVFDDLVRFVRASYVETDDERMARINKVCSYMAIVIPKGAQFFSLPLGVQTFILLYAVFDRKGKVTLLYTLCQKLVTISHNYKRDITSLFF